jgi:hypothetical protein
MRTTRFRLVCLLYAYVASIMTFMPLPASAHGSVTPDADLCLIRIGFFRAHFKVYLPETRGHDDFCEDLPDIGSSIFVM